MLFRAWVPFVIINVFYNWIDTGWIGLRSTYTDMLNSLEARASSAPPSCHPLEGQGVLQTGAAERSVPARLTVI